MGQRGERMIEQGWMVIFADLLALMLTFFVLLFAMTSVKMDAWNAIAEALAERLNPSHEWAAPALIHEKNVERRIAKRAVDLDYLLQVLREKIAAEETLSSAVLQKLDDRVVLSLPSDLWFQAGESELLETTAPAIAALVKALRVVGNQLNVVGHSDPRTMPSDARFASNWELSLARAVTVANALRASGYGLDIEAFGLSESRYFDISPALSEESRMYLSRRVDIVLRDSVAKEARDGR